MNTWKWVNICYRHFNISLGSDSLTSAAHFLFGEPRMNTRAGEVQHTLRDDSTQASLRPKMAAGCIGSTWERPACQALCSFLGSFQVQMLDRGPGCQMRFLRDDLQNVKDQLHDHWTLAQLTRPAMDDRDQSAVQVTQVLRQKWLTVASRQVPHLKQQIQMMKHRTLMVRKAASTSQPRVSMNVFIHALLSS